MWKHNKTSSQNQELVDLSSSVPIKKVKYGKISKTEYLCSNNIHNYHPTNSWWYVPDISLFLRKQNKIFSLFLSSIVLGAFGYSMDLSINSPIVANNVLEIKGTLYRNHKIAEKGEGRRIHFFFGENEVKVSR